MKMYINNILNLMSVYVILDEIKINKKVRLNDIMLKYIKENKDKDFNSISTKLLILEDQNEHAKQCSAQASD